MIIRAHITTLFMAHTCAPSRGCGAEAATAGVPIEGGGKEKVGAAARRCPCLEQRQRNGCVNELRLWRQQQTETEARARKCLMYAIKETFENVKMAFQRLPHWWWAGDASGRGEENAERGSACGSRSRSEEQLLGHRHRQRHRHRHARHVSGHKFTFGCCY